MGNAVNAHASIQAQATSLQTAGRFALQRHAEARARAPKRAAASYLRLACSCARQLAKLAPRYPAFWAIAQTLVVDVIALARQHEAELFEAGGNQGAAYISVWIAAEALQIQLADRCAQCIPAENAQPEPVLVSASAPAPPLAAARAPSAPDHAHRAPYSQQNAKRQARKWQRPRPLFAGD